MSVQVLIVDDEREIAEELAEFLDDREIPSRIVTSGEAALKAVATADITHVVLDLRMPGLGGLGVLDGLRERLAAGLRVAVISGHATIDDENAALEGGAALFLRKPFDPEKLFTSGFMSGQGDLAPAISIHSVVALDAGQVVEKAINPRVTLRAEISRVWSDESRVRQVSYDYRVLKQGGKILDSGRRSTSEAVFRYMFDLLPSA
jgi:CheY-like chemotaxis protein